MRGARGAPAPIAIAFVFSAWTLSVAGSPGIHSTFRVEAAGARVDVSTPQLFEPLRPGSVYPDRRRPVEPVRRPLIVIRKMAELDDEAREAFFERGFVLAEVDRLDETVLRAIVARLAERSEVDVSRLQVVGEGNDRFAAGPPLLGFAVVRPADSFRSGGEGSVPTLLLLATPRQLPSPELSAVFRNVWGENRVEKWYRSPGNRLPRQALRDAAEWMAERIVRAR